jgi:hypothetical protein
MGPRVWATIGNLFKIYAALGWILGALLGYRAIQANQQGLPSGYFLPLAGLAAVSFVVAILFWNIKGPLIRGNTIARILFGGYTLLGVITSLGLALIPIGIVYLFTGEPASYDYHGFRGKRKETKPRIKTPTGWQATGRVGPAGAMFYSGPGSGAAEGIFDSATPVQVVEKQNGYAQVVAATGQRGWIDLRTLTEGA